jgi:hypothetical protein
MAAQRRLLERPADPAVLAWVERPRARRRRGQEPQR